MIGSSFCRYKDPFDYTMNENMFLIQIEEVTLYLDVELPFLRSTLFCSSSCPSYSASLALLCRHIGRQKKNNDNNNNQFDL